MLLLALNAILTSCGGLFNPRSLQLVPYESPMVRFKYTVPPYTNINGGLRQISLDTAPFPSIVEPLCKNVTCPIQNGTYTKDVVWPNLSGTSTMKWFDPDATLLLCIRLKERLNNRALTLWNSRNAH